MSQERKEQLVNLLQSYIDELPDTPEKIAGFFAERGVKGHPNYSLDCVLARWLRSKGFRESGATREEIFGYDLTRPRSEQYQVVETPMPLREFLYFFDLGYYQSLVY